jgi:lysophospholipase L1-like esterase
MNSSALFRRLTLPVFFIITASALFAVEPLRVVGTGGRMGNSSIAVSGTLTSFRQRTPHKLGGPVAELDIGFMNWAHSTTAEVPNTNAVTLNYVWLERASTGQVVPLTFSNQRQLVMPAASTQAYWLADPIPSSVWTGAAPVRDELFWVHVQGSVPASGTIQTGTPTSFAGSKFIIYDPVNDPGTHDTAGAVPTITGASGRSIGLPLLFLGRYTGPGHLAVIGLGDSIMDGYGDTPNPVPVISGNGPLSRAALDANGANTIATLNITRGGEAAATWVNVHTRQAQIIPFANVLVEEFGTNDIGSSGGSANATTITNRLKAIWSLTRDAGVQKIVRTNLLPRSLDATHHWATKADQTPNPGWGVGGARDTVNTNLATALAAGQIDVLVDTLSTVQDATDSHYWLSNGTNNYVTTDGTHPSAAGHARLAAPLRTALLGLTVDQGPTGTVIVDNTAGGAAVTLTGAWTTATADTGYYGLNYLTDGNAGKGAKSVRFTPVITKAGLYEVSVRWGAGTGHAVNVPIDVVYDGGTDAAVATQQTDGGTWVPVGTYAFKEGNTGSVLISTTNTSGLVIADAVKFTPVTAPSVPGTSVTVQSWTAAPWNGVGGGTAFSGSFTPDGTPVTLTFANPKSGVNITTPSAPDDSTAAPSFFGFEGTGFGVGDSITLGRFDRGESLTLTATHAFTLQHINWREWTGDEVLHVKWTKGGIVQQQTFTMNAVLTNFTGIEADANTAVTITNVSPATANLNGRLRFNYLTFALLY